jgi:hypothetical protein
MRTVGEIAGWIRPDGLIDLELGGFRGIGSHAGWHTGGGMHRLTVSDGETTAVVLPPLSGTMTLGPASAELQAGRGVTVVGGKAVLDLGEFFDKSQTSILVTARRRR